MEVIEPSNDRANEYWLHLAQRNNSKQQHIVTVTVTVTVSTHQETFSLCINCIEGAKEHTFMILYMIM